MRPRVSGWPQSGVLGELVPVLREHGEVGRGHRGEDARQTIDRRLAFARSTLVLKGRVPAWM